MLWGRHAGYFEGGNISTGAVRDSRRPAKPKAKPAAKALRHLDLLRCQWLQDLQVLVELVADLWGYRGETIDCLGLASDPQPREWGTSRGFGGGAETGPGAGIFVWFHSARALILSGQ